MARSSLSWLKIFHICVVCIFGIVSFQFANGESYEVDGRAIPILQFTQLVDHFDPTNKATYLQRYSVDAPSSWRVGDPIFIFLDGEAPMEFFEFQEVQGRLWAKEFGAMYVSLEHRFYGNSIPNNSSNPYSSQNLRYLSSHQALADAAYFIQQFHTSTLPYIMKRGLVSAHDFKDASNSQWVVLGCSYSGALSAWFRSKYSHLVVASVAPSGPIYAESNYVAYNAWFQQVAPPACVAAVKSAVNSITQMLQTESGRAALETIFNSCAAIPADPREQYYFIYTLTNAVADSDQFENPPLWPLNSTCATMTSSTDYISNWAVVLANSNNSTLSRSQNNCNDFNEETAYLNPLRQQNNQDRSWLWQQCTEFGWFSPSDASIFWPDFETLTHQLKWCEQVFQIPGMSPHTDWTNSFYGGYNLQGTNIMFSNGIFDPWHLISINEDLPSGVQAVTYAAGHCAPMTQGYPDDPESLIEARKTIGAFLAKVLQN